MDREPMVCTRSWENPKRRLARAAVQHHRGEGGGTAWLDLRVELASLSAREDEGACGAAQDWQHAGRLWTSVSWRLRLAITVLCGKDCDWGAVVAMNIITPILPVWC
ncbi:hypothetical protein CGGC5_v005884 [Colletotrichum fructicola Nara gc5]|uniref:Uncharacterized protein n=1 Tax=Colletotrichum fructicola (strain Nara gc5) TaxID=1213859 RepID=A0A7J6IHR1_COLFN|nr:hypothetical protein CGGC5_v016021 [Colletotrichum fructicola Nara gc5]KAF4487193.1 hypothetical protein CGGC5_v005884 [Colletotrichum fructicola Nara gc5]